MPPIDEVALQQSPPNAAAPRCGAHDVVLYKLAQVDTKVERTQADFKEFTSDWKDHKEDVSKALVVLSDSMKQIDPAAVRSSATKSGVIVSGLVAIVVAIIANLDKIEAFLKQ